MNVLVIAAHPDDEVLGAGATMAKHSLQGDDVYVLIISQGQYSRSSQSDPAIVDSLHRASLASCAALGVNYLGNLGYPDNKLDTVPLLDIVQSIESTIDSYSPSIVYTHSCSDLNIDHLVVSRAVLTACRPQPGSSVFSIRGFEISSSTDYMPPGASLPFHPHIYVDVSGLSDMKLEALHCYEQEMRSWPHSRSYESISHQLALRGSQVGVEAAECFTLYRQIYANTVH